MVMANTGLEIGQDIGTLKLQADHPLQYQSIASPAVCQHCSELPIN
jgi:hypothetical protein